MKWEEEAIGRRPYGEKRGWGEQRTGRRGTEEDGILKKSELTVLLVRLKSLPSSGTLQTVFCFLLMHPSTQRAVHNLDKSQLSVTFREHRLPYATTQFEGALAHA